MEYKLVKHLNIECYVSKYGDVKDINGNKRNWHYNQDGYPCVSLKGQNGWRSIGVHILVAKGFVDNPDNKPEINHKDFNRANPCWNNLEWVTHKENIQYSSLYGRHARLYGNKNPNYQNTTLKNKYRNNPILSKEKQSRPGSQNGRAKQCSLYYKNKLIKSFGCQKDVIIYLRDEALIECSHSDSWLKELLRREAGYCDYKIVLN